VLELWDTFINRLRNFFRSRGYLEVSTPILTNFPNLDSNVEPIPVRVKFKGKHKRLWLQTSPEYSMKKIVSKYRKSIFQITKAFRDNEYGRFHRHEFHMLEWYKVGGNYKDLISEIKDLLRVLFGYRDFEELTVKEALKKYAGISLVEEEIKFRELLSKKGISFKEDEDWETLFYRVFVEIEKHLGKDKPLFLTDFPTRLCALAKINNNRAERFELFIKGVEIANGWTEETSEIEVRKRLEKEAFKRDLPVDEDFIKAHRSIPPCAGCSIGVDRLFTLWLGKESLKDTEILSVV